MELAALADVYGGGTGHLVLAADPATSLVYQAKALAAAELARVRDQRLAALIANEIAKRQR